ncbi:MAG: hypothetical protein ACO32I_09215 [Candidatus Limnocylindrus sp.]
MEGRIISEMRGGSKYDTVSAAIIYAGHDAGWSLEEINDMLVKAGKTTLVEGSYTRFVSAIRAIKACPDESKRQRAIDEWLCRNETSLAGLNELLK